jgi:hypothetical protein
MTSYISETNSHVERAQVLGSLCTRVSGNGSNVVSTRTDAAQNQYQDIQHFAMPKGRPRRYLLSN